MCTGKWVGIGWLGFVIACSSDDAVAPIMRPTATDTPNAAILPASSYTATVFKPAGSFNEVNGRNLIVGTAGDNAVAMVLGGALTKLANGPGVASRAEAVNERGEIVGGVNAGSLQSPRDLPAYWRRVGVGIVGHTNFGASFGDPDHTRYFNTTPTASIAFAVTGQGVATGQDQGVSVPWNPGINTPTAFVADRYGAKTILPYPPNGSPPWRGSYGFGLNNCGLVVGQVYTVYDRHPALWDPGC